MSDFKISGFVIKEFFFDSKIYNFSKLIPLLNFSKIMQINNNVNNNRISY